MADDLLQRNAEILNEALKAAMMTAGQIRDQQQATIVPAEGTPRHQGIVVFQTAGEPQMGLLGVAVAVPPGMGPSVVDLMATMIQIVVTGATASAGGRGGGISHREERTIEPRPDGLVS